MNAAPPGGGGGGGADTTPPAGTLAGKGKQDVDKLKLTVGSNEAATASGQATVSVPGGKKPVTSKTATATIAANGTAKLKFKFKKKTLKKIKTAARRGQEAEGQDRGHVHRRRRQPGHRQQDGQAEGSIGVPRLEWRGSVWAPSLGRQRGPRFGQRHLVAGACQCGLIELFGGELAPISRFFSSRACVSKNFPGAPSSLLTQ